jgi:hypothetical protein
MLGNKNKVLVSAAIAAMAAIMIASNGISTQLAFAGGHHHHGHHHHGHHHHDTSQSARIDQSNRCSSSDHSTTTCTNTATVTQTAH